MYEVVLVDDEPFAIEGLQLLVNWEPFGFRVSDVRRNGEEALKLILAAPPDLVVTDIRMPYLDGLEMIARIKEAGNNWTKFVIMSGYDDFAYAKQAIRLGVDHYLTKPIITEEADAVLAKLATELHEQSGARMIQALAGKFAVRQGISALLNGHPVPEAFEGDLQRLSATAEAWHYIGISPAHGEEETVRAAAAAFAEDYPALLPADPGDGTIGLILGSGGAREEVLRMAEMLRAWLAGQTANGAAVTVGSRADRLSGIAHSRSSAVEAGRLRYFAEGREVILHEDIHDRAFSFDLRTMQAADTAAELMESGDREALLAALQDLFDIFERQRMLPELVEVFASHAKLRCLAVYRELGGDSAGFLAAAVDEAYAAEGNTLGDIKRKLTAFCLECQRAVSVLQEQRSGGTIAHVAEFLRNHYRETHTIKEIAERFFLNPVYLGHAFTAKYGKSILDFVHDLRIEEAKRRLRETDDTSAAVAEALGYGSYQHFLRQFEKRAGQKPAEYKQGAQQSP